MPIAGGFGVIIGLFTLLAPYVVPPPPAPMPAPIVNVAAPIVNVPAVAARTEASKVIVPPTIVTIPKSSTYFGYIEDTKDFVALVKFIDKKQHTFVHMHIMADGLAKKKKILYTRPREDQNDAPDDDDGATVILGTGKFSDGGLTVHFPKPTTAYYAHGTVHLEGFFRLGTYGPIAQGWFDIVADPVDESRFVLANGLRE